MEDAVLHGCIPVILQDGLHTPWESVLDWRAYALRVRRHEMGNPQPEPEPEPVTLTLTLTPPPPYPYPYPTLPGTRWARCSR